MQPVAEGKNTLTAFKLSRATWWLVAVASRVENAFKLVAAVQRPRYHKESPIVKVHRHMGHIVVDQVTACGLHNPSSTNI